MPTRALGEDLERFLEDRPIRRGGYDGRAMLALVPAESLAGRGQHRRGSLDDRPCHRFNNCCLDVPRSRNTISHALSQARQSEAQERLGGSRSVRLCSSRWWTRREPDGTAAGRDSGSRA